MFGCAGRMLGEVWPCWEGAGPWSSNAQVGLGACLGDVHDTQVMPGDAGGILGDAPVMLLGLKQCSVVSVGCSGDAGQYWRDAG